MKYVFVLFFLVSSSTGVIAQKSSASFGVHIDQDFFADWLHNEDRNYTQGTAFSYTQLGQESKNFLFVPLNLFYLLGNVIVGTDPSSITNLPATINFGVTAFTPLNIRTNIPEYGDRPYSNIVFIETKRATLRGRNYHSWSMTYGLLGTNASKEFQTFAHLNLFKGRGVPLGWDTQISKGGKFAWLVTNSFKAPLRYKQYDKVDISDNPKKFEWDATYGIESAAGYYTYFGANIGARLGRIHFLNYYKTGSNSLSSGDKKFSDTDKSVHRNSLATKEKKFWEHYFFLNFGPRLFARNSLIQGQKSHGTYEYFLNSKYLSTFVAETEFGFTSSRTKVILDDAKNISSINSLQVSISFKQRTAEYRYPGYTRSHYWGCLSLILPLK